MDKDSELDGQWIEAPRGTTIDHPVFVPHGQTRGDVIETRRRKALSEYGIDPTDWPLFILRDDPSAIEVKPTKPAHRPANEEIPPLCDEAWNLIADVFPKPHANQNLGWRETLDALIVLTQTGMSWIRLGKHSEAIRARLHRSRTEQWDDIEQRIDAAEIDAAERERITTLCTFAKRYLAERDARANVASTPTAAQRLLKDL
jgi:hypothetical protein